VNGDLGPACATADRDVYARLIADLDASGAHYRLIEHAPEGRGAHARSAIGVAAPPPGTPVEVEAIAQVSTGAADEEAQPQ
jgi:enamine deaminase RidA (YjgF/YER057c/UK114 family)